MRDPQRGGELAAQAAVAAGILALATACALALRPHVAATNLAMLYLLGVVATAMRCGRRVSVAASFLNVAAFDFFCVPPYLTFRVSHYEYLFTFAGMLVVALVISAQTARIRLQAEAAVEREARTAPLPLFRCARRPKPVAGICQAAARRSARPCRLSGSPSR